MNVLLSFFRKKICSVAGVGSPRLAPQGPGTRKRQPEPQIFKGTRDHTSRTDIRMAAPPREGHTRASGARNPEGPNPKLALSLRGPTS